MRSDRVVRTPEELRILNSGRQTGLVPTMGALHEGHLSLIRRSAAENDQTVVSIFVNPTQFEQSADLATYPREPARDEAIAFDAGADLVYAPTVDTVYPPGFSTRVSVGEKADRWEGESRPVHFAGVATVVTILLNSVGPARSYFGEKDYQQLVVIRQLHHDLLLPGVIVGCPTVRDRDGLALSSRNARLTTQERAAASAVPDALFAIRDRVLGGETDAATLTTHGRSIIAAEALLTPEYLAIVDGSNLRPIDRIQPGARALIAVQAGHTRLIDNLALNQDAPD